MQVADFDLLAEELDVAVAAGADVAASMAAERAAAAVTHLYLLVLCSTTQSLHRILVGAVSALGNQEWTTMPISNPLFQVVAAALALGSTDNVTAVVGAIRWE